MRPSSPRPRLYIEFIPPPQLYPEQNITNNQSMYTYHACPGIKHSLISQTVVAIHVWRPTIKPVRRNDLHRIHPSYFHVRLNLAYNGAATDYNARLENAHGRNNIPGNVKFMRLVNPINGRFFNDSRADTPANKDEIDAMTMAEWIPLGLYYHLNFTPTTTLREMRNAYRAFMGLGI